MPLNKKLTEDPATKFDRTNMGDGIYQMRELITQALAPTSPLLRGETFEAIALWVSSPTLITPFVGGTIEGPLGDLLYNPEMKIKIYFRVPVIHSNLPLPNSFNQNFSEDISKIKPEERNELLISCHPFLYADFDSSSEITAGDIITIRFLDNGFGNAELVIPEEDGEETTKKSTNSIPAPRKIITNFVKSVKDLFNDSGETAILGSDIEVSPQARKFAEKYYDIMKERSPCKFLSDWKTRFQRSFAEAEDIAQSQSKKYPDSIPAIRAASETHGVPYSLLLAIAKTESRFNPHAYNTKTEPGNKYKPTYATGLFQILPPFYVGYGLPPPPSAAVLASWVSPESRGSHDAWDPYRNSLAAAKRLRQNMDKTSRRLGRPAEPWEVYVTHNQGHDTFYVQTVACELYGPNGGVDELATALQLIINNNFNAGATTPKTKSDTNQNLFFGGRWHKVPKTNKEEWSEGLSPDIPSLKNLTRT